MVVVVESGENEDGDLTFEFPQLPLMRKDRMSNMTRLETPSRQAPPTSVRPLLRYLSHGVGPSRST